MSSDIERAASAENPGFRRSLRRFLPLLLPALAVCAVLASGSTRYLSLEMLAENRDALAATVARNPALAMAVFFAAFTSAAAVGLAGGAILTMIGGFLFGGPMAAMIALAASAVGGSLFFLFARSSFGSGLARKPWPLVARLRDGFHRDAVAYLLFLRLTPAFPFFVVNLAMALTELKLSTFIWATIVGLIPATLTYAFAGAGIDAVLVERQHVYAACQAAGQAAGQADCRMSIQPRDFVTTQMLLALAGLGVLALLPPLLRRLPMFARAQAR